jgi:hypothetical protein
MLMKYDAGARTSCMQWNDDDDHGVRFVIDQHTV